MQNRLQHHRSTNISLTTSPVKMAEREERNRHKGCVLWMTGLSASGKSTLACHLERLLFNSNCHPILLDGDRVRNGLCGDLDFSEDGRDENIRRVAELSHLFYDQGHIVICAFISPLNKHRKFARSLLPESRFFEIFIECSLETCKKRDPKGLYQKALNGEINDFTGISAPFDAPESPEFTANTEKNSPEKLSLEIVEFLKQKAILPLNI